MRIARASVCLTFGLITIPSLPVYADSSAQLALHGGIESYSWKEKIDGATVLEEDGTLFALEIGANNYRRLSRGSLLGIALRLDVGNPAVDEELIPGITGSSKTSYWGINGELQGGYRLSKSLKGYDFLGGLGFDTWVRNIDDYVDSSGSAIAGWKELDFIIYSKLAVGFADEHGAWAYRIQTGLRYPLYLYNRFTTTGANISFKPEPKASLFAKLAFEFGPNVRKRWGLDLIYDSYRLGKSADKQDAFGNVYFRPEVERDILGIQLGYYFL